MGAKEKELNLWEFCNEQNIQEKGNLILCTMQNILKYLRISGNSPQLFYHGTKLNKGKRKLKWWGNIPRDLIMQAWHN